MKIVNITGGLGNQMFQYAFALALKERYPNEKILIDTTDYKRYIIHNGYELEKLFDIQLKHASIIEQLKVFYPFQSSLMQKLGRVFSSFPYKNVVSENEDMNFHPEIMERAESTFYLGFWQSEKYFKGIKDKIKDIYHFPKDENILNLRLKEEISNLNSTSLHVRHGDYLNFKNTYGICDLNYYQKAVSFIIERSHPECFVIFSDDLNWCRTFIAPMLGQYKLFFVDWNKRETSFRDMELMSYCRNNIIANSTFSWWGAWLNEHSEKIVVAPSQWMRSGGWDDIIPEGWVRV